MCVPFYAGIHLDTLVHGGCGRCWESHNRTLPLNMCSLRKLIFSNQSQTLLAAMESYRKLKIAKGKAKEMSKTAFLAGMSYSATQFVRRVEASHCIGHTLEGLHHATLSVGKQAPQPHHSGKRCVKPLAQLPSAFI